jgi:hypothetical protein
MPSASACRWDTSGIQDLGDLPQRRRTSFLGLSNDGKHIGRVSVGFRRYGNLRIPAGHVELWATQGHPTGLCRRKGLPGPGADQRPLLLSQRGEQVQDKGVNVRAQLCDQEGDLVRHQSADEVNIPAEAIKFGDSYVGSLLPSGSQCGSELRPAVERVCALAGLHLYKFAGELETLRLRKVT